MKYIWLVGLTTTAIILLIMAMAALGLMFLLSLLALATGWPVAIGFVPCYLIVALLVFIHGMI